MANFRKGCASMKKRSVIAIGAAFLVICAAVGWAALNGQAAAEITKQKTDKPAVEQSASMPEIDSQEVSVIHAYEEPWPMEKLMEKSTLVVRGTVESADVLEISGVQGGSLTMTEYQVKVSEVLRGEEKASVSVLRIGDPTNEQVFFESEPLLEQGKEYLLFLQSRDLGGDFNFPGEHYRVLGDRQGVFESTASEKARESETFSNQKELAKAALEKAAPESVSYGGIQKELKQVNAETPPDPQLFRNEYLEALEGNLETGFITEEEYKAAIAELDQYAVVISRQPLWK